jgi:hypothetical protein
MKKYVLGAATPRRTRPSKQAKSNANFAGAEPLARSEVRVILTGK